MPRRIWTTRQLARRHGVSQRTIQRWLRDGWLPDDAFRTVGGHWRIQSEDYNPAEDEIDLMDIIKTLRATIYAITGKIPEEIGEPPPSGDRPDDDGSLQS